MQCVGPALKQIYLIKMEHKLCLGALSNAFGYFVLCALFGMKYDLCTCTRNILHNNSHTHPTVVCFSNSKQRNKNENKKRCNKI